MTKEEAIKFLQQLYPNGGHCWLDEQRIEAISMAVKALQEEPVAPKVLEDMLNAKTAAESLGISQEEHDRIVDKLIYGKEPELVDIDDLPNKEEEPVSEDLEEEIGRYFKENGNKWAYIDVARHFANWQKQQMMKDAVPATVLTNQYGNKYIRSWSGLREYNKFKNGDEVKVYLIKED